MPEEKPEKKVASNFPAQSVYRNPQSDSLSPIEKNSMQSHLLFVIATAL